MFSRVLVPLGLPDDWKRLTPISLSREEPVAQFVIDRALALSALFQPFCDFLFRFRARQTVDDRRIDSCPFANKSEGRLVSQRSDNFDDRQIELAGEFKIAFVVRGH